MALHAHPAPMAKARPAVKSLLRMELTLDGCRLAARGAGDGRSNSEERRNIPWLAVGHPAGECSKRGADFYTGDVGVFGPDGRMSLRGRVSDVVNVLGTKIATGGIEQALQDRLGAEGICILSLPDHHGDEQIHLITRNPWKRPSRRLRNAAACARFRMQFCSAER